MLFYTKITWERKRRRKEGTKRRRERNSS